MNVINERDEGKTEKFDWRADMDASITSVFKIEKTTNNRKSFYRKKRNNDTYITS